MHGRTGHLRTFGGLALESSDFTRPKPLLLLAYLVVEGPQHRRRVAELFWPSGTDAMKSLTVALARIRKGAPGVVDSDGERVWATVDSDVEELLDRIERGDRRRALEAYGGPFLEGFALRSWSVELEDWVFRTREYFEAQVRGALLHLADAEAARARWERAAAHAERAHALADGATEPEDLAQIHTLLLAGESPLAAEARRRAEPFELPLCADAAAARERLDAPEARGRPSVPHNLPVRGTPFVGRDLEITEIATHLTGSQATFVTLTGPGGVGKSRLALRVAGEQLALGQFPDGVYVVELESLTAADAIPTAIADALRIPTGEDGDTLRRTLDGIGDREILLVLDGFEHVIDGAGVAAELVHACPGLGLLVTSRQRLNLEEEQIFPVRGLPYPEGGSVGVEEALRFDAVALYASRAVRAHPDFQLTDRTLPAVIETCRRVEGLPLGIELAAAWLRAMSPDQVVEELTANPDALVARTRNVPERHQSLRRAFEHSWRLLSSEERRVLRRLAAFRGGFRRRAAGEVAGATIPALVSLVEKSLLRVDGSGRYDRHPLLYQYTQEKLAERPEERAVVRERHGRWFLAHVARFEDDLVGAAQTDAIAAIEDELENVQEAWRWAAETSAVDELRRICRPLQIFYIQRGGMAEAAAREYAYAADRLDASEPELHDVLGRLRAAEAWFRFRLGDDAGGGAAAEAALRLLLPLVGDRSDAAVDQAVVRAVGSAWNTLGNIAKRRSDYATAERRFREAMDLAKRWGHVRQTAIVTNNMASLLKSRGRYREAEALFREAISLNRRLGNHRSVVRNLTNLGGALVLQGDPKRASHVLEEALKRASEIGYEDVVPHILFNLGGAAFGLGDPLRARRLCQEVLERRGDAVTPGYEADLRCWIGRSAAALGDVEDALDQFRTAIELAWSAKQDAVVVTTLVCLAELYVLRGEGARAAGILRRIPADAPVSGVVDDLRQRLEREVAGVLAAGDARPEVEGAGAHTLESAVAEALRQVAAP